MRRCFQKKSTLEVRNPHAIVLVCISKDTIGVKLKQSGAYSCPVDPFNSSHALHKL